MPETPSLAALGRLVPDGDRWQLRFVRHLPHPPEKVWRAVTEPEHLAVWFPTTIDGDRAAGAELTFEFPHEGAPAMKGEMLTWDPPRLLELRWGDEDVLRIELAPDDDAAGGTRLTLTDVFTEKGKAARDGAGWHACLDVLGAHLAGDHDGDDEPRWARLAPVYRDAFGPDAATIGPPDWHPEP